MGNIPIIFSDIGRKGVLNNVLFVPKLEANLISIRLITRRGLTI